MNSIQLRTFSCACLVLFISLSVNVKAQWFGTSPVYTTSNVGIGLTNPVTKLHLLGNSILNGNVQIGSISIPTGYRLAVDGNIMLSRNPDGGWGGIRSNILTGVLEFNILDGPTIELYGKNYPATSYDSRAGTIRFISRGSAGEGISFMNYDPLTTTWRRTMTVTNDNKVYLGDVKPSGNFADYRLGIDGTLVAKRCVIQITDWADFVFKPDYVLKPLSEVESYISENHHLPDVPAEDIVLKNGMDVSEINKLLLQKIEELTLYVIELKKENELIKAKLNEQ